MQGPAEPSRPPPRLIQEPSALAEALETFAGADRLAVDTETDAFFAHQPQVCLIQVSTADEDFLVDPLADLELEGLGQLLADAGRQTVLHAAENDVIQLHHQYGWRIGHLFDTQVAAFVLGRPPYSLAGILQEQFGLKLDKKMQRSDWSRRPLSEEQVRYAANDTAHLLDLADRLREEARRQGREEEIAAECRRVAAREWEPLPFDPEAFRKIKGAKDLDAVQQRVLRDLYQFRNNEAERRNRAAYRIASDQVLMDFARRKRAGPGRGVSESFWRRYGKRVQDVVRGAVRRGPLHPPRRPRRSREEISKDVRRAYDALRRWRGRAAEERGVESFVVARNELLMQVARRMPQTPADLSDVLEPFRLHEYGEAMVQAILESPDSDSQNGPSGQN